MRRQPRPINPLEQSGNPGAPGRAQPSPADEPGGGDPGGHSADQATWIGMGSTSSVAIANACIRSDPQTDTRARVEHEGSKHIRYGTPHREGRREEISAASFHSRPGPSCGAQGSFAEDAAARHVVRGGSARCFVSPIEVASSGVSPAAKRRVPGRTSARTTAIRLEGTECRPGSGFPRTSRGEHPEGCPSAEAMRGSRADRAPSDTSSQLHALAAWPIVTESVSQWRTRRGSLSPSR